MMMRRHTAPWSRSLVIFLAAVIVTTGWAIQPRQLQFSEILEVPERTCAAGGQVRVIFKEDVTGPPWNLASIYLHGPNLSPVGIPLWFGPYMGSHTLSVPIVWDLDLPAHLQSGRYSLNFSYMAGPQSYAVDLVITGDGSPSETPWELSEETGRKIPLCPEARFFPTAYLARAGFLSEKDMETTSFLMDEADLMKGFRDAIGRYEEESQGSVYARPTAIGAMPAATWLASEAGMSDRINRQFVYYAGTLAPGTEPALRDAIVAFSRDQQRKLTPSDVFYLALKERQGDAKAAMLLAHNTLRTLSRPDKNSDDPKYLEKLVGLKYQAGFVDEFLEPMRTYRGDNSGPWYHLFGMGYFSIEAQGDWGPMAMLLYANPATGTKAYLLKRVLEGLMHEAGIKHSDQEFWSQVANWFEQYVRAEMGSVPDPEKFCVNVWGAKIGTALYKELPMFSGREFAPSPGDPEPGLTEYTIFGPINLPLPNRFHRDPRVLISGSPVAVTIEGNGYTMRMDQRTGNVLGYYPLLLMPILEQDGTWAAAWLELDDQPYQVTFEAVADGTLHVGEVDGRTRQLAYYETQVKLGDRWTLEVNPAAPAAAMLPAAGSPMPPTLRPLDGAWFAEVLDSTMPVTQEKWPQWSMWMGAALAAGGTGLLLWLLGRRRAAQRIRLQSSAGAVERPLTRSSR